ncbi:hypothetical protein [Microbacterium sp.]|uniref:hypothetical protein n=1 Tax=Microbacterium sp. TaxID=51671 RepID=UPI0037C5B71E
MSDFREPVADDEREVPVDDESELELPPATIDPDEAVEEEVDAEELEQREAAIEAGEIVPDDL